MNQSKPATLEPPAARARPMRASLPFGRDPAAVRARLELLEGMLERGVRVPGTNRQFGLDAVIGLVPVAGDLIAAGLGAYMLWEARNIGLPRWKLWRMGGNIAFDTAVGAVPVVGDLFDVAFRSNTRNLRIIRRHLDKAHPASRVLEG